MKKIAWFLLFLALAANPIRLQAEPAYITTVFDRQYYPVALKMVNEAKKSLDLAIFEIRYYPEYPHSPSNLLIEGLIAAAGRGLDVEVCLEQSKGYNQDNTLDNLKAAYKLTAGGVKVYLDKPQKTLHAKFLVADQRLVLAGSTNWAYNSLSNNRETNLLVDSRQTAEKFLGYFEAIKKESKLFKP